MSWEGLGNIWGTYGVGERGKAFRICWAGLGGGLEDMFGKFWNVCFEGCLDMFASPAVALPSPNRMNAL